VPLCAYPQSAIIASIVREAAEPLPSLALNSAGRTCSSTKVKDSFKLSHVPGQTERLLAILSKDLRRLSCGVTSVWWLCRWRVSIRVFTSDQISSHPPITSQWHRVHHSVITHRVVLIIFTHLPLNRYPSHPPACRGLPKSLHHGQHFIPQCHMISHHRSQSAMRFDAMTGVVWPPHPTKSAMMVSTQSWSS
jgi:hypothetical protein